MKKKEKTNSKSNDAKKKGSVVKGIFMFLLLTGMTIVASKLAYDYFFVPIEYDNVVGSSADGSPFISEAAKKNRESKLVKEIPSATGDKQYNVYQYSNLLGSFDDYAEALETAVRYDHSCVIRKGESSWLWDNYPAFNVFTDALLENDEFAEFDAFSEAAAFASAHEGSYIYYRVSNTLAWTNETPLPDSHLIDGVPHVRQYPELPRGCEVTSLTMLLQFAGYEVDKMTLAEQIRKDPTAYTKRDGRLYAGNPNFGFVGDMYNMKKHGLGVYAPPIFDLASEYIGDETLDVSGTDFENLFYFISNGIPVWIIINTTYAPLPDNAFETWHTDAGPINITYREHSVVVTGYDDKFIYFNDPLLSRGNHKADRSTFIAAWEQMGSQAVTYCP